MNRYKKSIQTIKNRHNRIVAFSKKIQEAMGLSDEDAKWAFINNVSWDIPGHTIICSYNQYQSVFTVMSDGYPHAIGSPSKAKQKEILKLIKKEFVTRLCIIIVNEGRNKQNKLLIFCDLIRRYN